MKKLIFLFLILTQASLATEATFSGTQEWGLDEIYFLETWKPVYVNKDHKAYTTRKHDFRKFDGKKEITELLKLQKMRTTVQMQTIEREKHLCGFHMNGYRVGKNPKLDTLVMNAYFDARKWGFGLKKHYDRVRPSFFDTRIQPSIDNPPHAAYPSNHSFQAHVIAHVLGDIYPKKRKEYLKAAGQIARNREIAGVHYPSDSEFGKTLAKEFHRELNKVKAYKRDVSAFRGKQLEISDSPDSLAEYQNCQKSTRQYANAKGVWPEKR